MRITSITVRNYRIHREAQVQLDPSRTLIGGPNEAGKSTLVEAVHRALFLKAKISGETQKSMVSRIHSGHPEVEVCFEAGGQSYRIVKRFSGVTGTALLCEAGGKTLNGDEAEARLAQILGVEASGGGRGAGDRAAQQWAHLWIWQGKAGDDPTEHANAQKDSLLARLQTAGGAAAMQSEVDAAVASALATSRENLFNKNGAPKRDSDLGRAIEQEQADATVLAEAQATLARLQQAAQDLQEADRIIKTGDDTLEQIRSQKASVDTNLGCVAELRRSEEKQALAAETAAARHKQFTQADKQIRQLGEQIEEIRSKLEPKNVRTEQLEAEHLEAGKLSRMADEECQRASDLVRVARLRHELARAQVHLIEKTAQRDQLRCKLKQIQGLRISLAQLQENLAKTPAITSTALKRLQKLETLQSNAQAALDAMAAGIEVVSSDLAVQVGERILSVGEVCVLSEEMEVTIGPAVRLRIQPGGGTSLAEARTLLQDAGEAVREALDVHGLGSVTEASEALARRQQLDAEIKGVNASLSACGGDTIDQELLDSETAVASAEGDVQRRSLAVKNFIATSSLAKAQQWFAETEQDLRNAEAHEEDRKADRKSAAAASQKVSDALLAHRQTVQDEKNTLAGLQAQRRLLLDTHGEDADRAQKLDAALAEKGAADLALEQTRAALAKLQPDLLEADCTRLQRALDEICANKKDAELNRAVARNILQSDGSTDPQSMVALAEAKARSAREHRISVERKAKAIQLLNDLFIEEQQALADQFTKPLSERISVYLQCLFGPDAHAAVSLRDNSFAGLQLVRPAAMAGALAFETLSGGAREQVAAAVRLAMAEVLAQAHDNCLPLVFDDAFAYSDPERVQTLQRMLDIAATRGIQIIVLTCNPADYAALGAKQILLRVERASHLPAANQLLSSQHQNTASSTDTSGANNGRKCAGI